MKRWMRDYLEDMGWVGALVAVALAAMLLLDPTCARAASWPDVEVPASGTPEVKLKQDAAGGGQIVVADDAGTTVAAINGDGSIEATTATFSSNLRGFGGWNLITPSTIPWHTDYVLQVGSNKSNQPDFISDDDAGGFTVKTNNQMTADVDFMYGQTIKPFLSGSGTTRTLGLWRLLFIEAHPTAVGALATVENQVGMHINSMLAGTVDNIGAWIDGPSGAGSGDNIALYLTSPSGASTGNWAILQTGDAPSYLGGTTTVGANGTNPGLIVGGGDDHSGYSYVQLEDAQTGGADWILGAGIFSPGQFIVRQSGVGNFLTVAKTTGAVGVTNDLTVGGDLNLASPTVPSSASDTGTAGDIAWDSDYIYICTATDTWKRAAISTW